MISARSIYSMNRRFDRMLTMISKCSISDKMISAISRFRLEWSLINGTRCLWKEIGMDGGLMCNLKE